MLKPAINVIRRSGTDLRARHIAAEELSSPLPAPDGALASAESDATVERALGALPEGGRRVLLLRWKHGLSFAEIAETLGISEGAAKVHASRARRALAPLLRQLSGEEP